MFSAYIYYTGDLARPLGNGDGSLRPRERACPLGEGGVRKPQRRPGTGAATSTVRDGIQKLLWLVTQPGEACTAHAWADAVTAHHRRGTDVGQADECDGH